MSRRRSATLRRVIVSGTPHGTMTPIEAAGQHLVLVERFPNGDCQVMFRGEQGPTAVISNCDVLAIDNVGSAI